MTEKPVKLKTKYRYIKFEVWGMEELMKWACLDKKEIPLGYAIFYEPWNQWVMEFEPECVFNNSCLRDITDFLEQLNKHRR